MEPVLVCGMRTGIDITVSAACRQRLEASAADRNTPHKHVWRACIVLLTADGLGTGAIMAATGKSKTCVWRWQERFMREGVDGLLRNKTRPPGVAPLCSDVGSDRCRHRVDGVRAIAGPRAKTFKRSSDGASKASSVRTSRI